MATSAAWRSTPATPTSRWCPVRQPRAPLTWPACRTAASTGVTGEGRGSVSPAAGPIRRRPSPPCWWAVPSRASSGLPTSVGSTAQRTGAGAGSRSRRSPRRPPTSAAWLAYPLSRSVWSSGAESGRWSSARTGLAKQVAFSQILARARAGRSAGSSTARTPSLLAEGRRSRCTVARRSRGWRPPSPLRPGFVPSGVPNRCDSGPHGDPIVWRPEPFSDLFCKSLTLRGLWSRRADSNR